MPTGEGFHRRGPPHKVDNVDERALLGSTLFVIEGPEDLVDLGGGECAGLGLRELMG
jgi:hypothetical protein